VRGVTPIASATSVTVRQGPAVPHHTRAKHVRKGTVSHCSYPFSKHRVHGVLALLTLHGIVVLGQIPPLWNLPDCAALYEKVNGN
jgi:hypothetical protein